MIGFKGSFIEIFLSCGIAELVAYRTIGRKPIYSF